VEGIRQSEAPYSKVFNTRLWEDIQNRISRVLGVSIKVLSEDGSINIPESNFSGRLETWPAPVVESTCRNRDIADRPSVLSVVD